MLKKLTGKASNYKLIAKANNITDFNKIFAGKELIIPKELLQKSSTKEQIIGPMPLTSNQKNNKVLDIIYSMRDIIERPNTSSKEKSNTKKSKGFKEGYGGGYFGGGGFGGSWDPNEQFDYIRNTPIISRISFGDAFHKAEVEGKDKFIFNGAEYPVIRSDHPKYTQKEYEDTIVGNLREVLDENQHSIADSTRIEPWVGQIPGTIKRERKDKLKIK